MTDFDERFAVGNQVRLGGRELRILDVKERKKQLLLKLDGIDGPEEASSLSGSLLTIREVELAPLGEDQYYRFQLVGLNVFDDSGRAIGSVVDILDTGETQVLVVSDGGGEVLVPLVSDFVTQVDLKAGQIQADLSSLQPRRATTRADPVRTRRQPRDLRSLHG
jgi:16S rRNA processing protein RimM